MTAIEALNIEHEAFNSPYSFAALPNGKVLVTAKDGWRFDGTIFDSLEEAEDEVDLFLCEHSDEL